jgi:hypothetical protein
LKEIKNIHFVKNYNNNEQSITNNNKYFEFLNKSEKIINEITFNESLLDTKKWYSEKDEEEEINNKEYLNLLLKDFWDLWDGRIILLGVGKILKF